MRKNTLNACGLSSLWPYNTSTMLPLFFLMATWLSSQVWHQYFRFLVRMRKDHWIHVKHEFRCILSQRQRYGVPESTILIISFKQCLRECIEYVVLGLQFVYDEQLLTYLETNIETNSRRFDLSTRGLGHVMTFIILTLHPNSEPKSHKFNETRLQSLQQQQGSPEPNRHSLI